MESLVRQIAALDPLSKGNLTTSIEARGRRP